MDISKESAAFVGLVDLAAEKTGAKALLASDDFFAPKENLLKPGRGVFIPDKFTENGKWMDGWESRRKRVPGYDWCVIRLGLAGKIHGVDIDTNHFLGNNPAYASIDACALEKENGSPETWAWTEILKKSPLRPGFQNLFAVASGEKRWTHVRLNIYPDGGVARFRVYGEVIPNFSSKKDQAIDLAALENGGIVVAVSDMFFSPKDNLIMPGRAANMGEGWETRRRRGPGFDWSIVQLGQAGEIQKIEIDTNHFKGNYPDTASLEGCYLPDTSVDGLTCHQIEWKEILPKTKLQAHTQHYFEKELKAIGPCTHVKLNIYPDGGVSRLRIIGKPKG